jgi:uncharacterized membrane protein (UPF0127 family)
MRKLSYCFSIFFTLIALQAPAYAAENPASAAPVQFGHDKLTIKVAGGERHFDIEVAKTPAQQRYGLMYRKELPHDHGMLFIWPRDIPVTMWMKNTKLSLDMLFVDATGRIVYIKENAKPESTEIISAGAGKAVRGVIELAGGASKEFSIRTGDKVISPYFKP